MFLIAEREARGMISDDNEMSILITAKDLYRAVISGNLSIAEDTLYRFLRKLSIIRSSNQRHGYEISVLSRIFSKRGVVNSILSAATYERII